MVEPGETGSIKIDVVREEIRQTAFKPFEARRRVIIFNDAESLGDDAQNALLKTLEEPPPGSVLILVTAQPNRLLATVRSRCPVVRFAPLAAGRRRQWLDAGAWGARDRGACRGGGGAGQPGGGA